MNINIKTVIQFKKHYLPPELNHPDCNSVKIALKFENL